MHVHSDLCLDTSKVSCYCPPLRTGPLSGPGYHRGPLLGQLEDMFLSSV